MTADKYYFILFLVFICADCFKISAQVYDLGVPVREINNNFVHTPEITDSVNYFVYELNLSSLNELTRTYHDSILLKLRYKDRDIEMLLFPNINMFSFDTYMMEGDSKLSVNYRLGKYYYGRVKGAESESLVALSFFDQTAMGIISVEGIDLTLFPYVDTDQKSSSLIMLGLMEEAQIKENDSFFCGVGDLETNFQAEDSSINLRSGNLCFASYLEIDYRMFQHFGNVDATLNWVSSMYNAVSTIYLFEQINTRVSEVLVWAQEDPYPTGESTLDNLLVFRTAMSSGFNGDLSHLISWRNMGGEGRAYVGTICNVVNLGVKTAFSRVAPMINDYPNYNRSIKVITHEIGHNLGTHHTHRCVWNGSDTQIDDYGNIFPSGNIPNEQEGAPCWNINSPLLSETPTIMSYYDSFGHGTFPMSNGFGIQPGNLIRSFLSNCPNCSDPQIEANCVSNLTLSLDDSGEAILNASALNNGSTGGSAPLQFSIEDSPTKIFDCEHIGNNNVELKVTDQNGNTQTCNTTVSIEDTIPPYIICPSDVTATTPWVESSAFVALELSEYSDNCTVDLVVNNQTDGGFDASGNYPVNESIVEFTVIDQSGNESSCLLSVNVIRDDPEPIQAICISDTTLLYLDASGEVALDASALDGGSTGGAPTLTFSIAGSNQLVFNCENLGINPVALEVTDQLGNMETCMAYVQVDLDLKISADISILGSDPYCINQRGIMYGFNWDHNDLPCQFDSLGQDLHWQIHQMGNVVSGSEHLLRKRADNSVVLNLDGSLSSGDYELVCDASVYYFKNGDTITTQISAKTDFNITDEWAPEKVNIYLYPGNIFYFKPDGGYSDEDVPCFEWGYRSAEAAMGDGDVVIKRDSELPRISESGFALFANEWDKLDKIMGINQDIGYYLWVDKWWPDNDGNCSNQLESCITRTYFNSSLPPVGAPRSSLDSETISLTLFPNPNDGSFNITMDNEYIGEYQVNIMDSYGRVVWHGSFDKAESIFSQSIQIAGLSSGMYFLYVKDTDGRMGVRKMVVW